MDSLTIERMILTGYFLFCQIIESVFFLYPRPVWAEYSIRIISLIAIIVVMVSNFELNIYRHVIWPALFSFGPMLSLQLVKALDDARRAARKAEQNQILLEQAEKELLKNG